MPTHDTTKLGLAFAVYTLPAVSLAVAVRGKIHDAQVNPKHTVNYLLVWLRHIAHGQQVERAPVVEQIALTLAPSQQCTLMLACDYYETL
jgi:hypothetical protein